MACDYDGELRAIIHAFKYDGRRSLARPLGALLREAGRAVLDGADAVVPVPLHPWKRLRRGFNQAADLAAHARPAGARRCCGAFACHAARRPGLSPGARRRNVRGAFAIAAVGGAPRARRPHLEDRVLVLVDDVMTTAPRSTRARGCSSRQARGRCAR